MLWRKAPQHRSMLDPTPSAAQAPSLRAQLHGRDVSANAGRAPGVAKWDSGCNTIAGPRLSATEELMSVIVPPEIAEPAGALLRTTRLLASTTAQTGPRRAPKMAPPSDVALLPTKTPR